MTRQQLAHWLTQEEIRHLHPDEALVLLMVREARLDGTWSVWPSSRVEVGPLRDAALPTAHATPDAFALNAADVAADARHSTAHLAPNRIQRHIARRWNAEAGQQIRDAAARDRGFRDFDGAVEVARAYYLGVRAAAVTNSPSATGSARAGDSART